MLLVVVQYIHRWKEVEIVENMDNLKELRIKKNLSQIEVAKLIGVSANTYRNWEYGANDPSEENMDKLKKVLEIK